jgi:Zinc carboxypeptidase
MAISRAANATSPTPMRESHPEPVAVAAIRIGRTELGAGTVVVDDEAVIAAVSRAAAEDRAIRVRLAEIVEATTEGGALTLRLRDGTEVTIVGQQADNLRAQIVDRCRAIPELTRALRALGSRRGQHADRTSAADEQQRFFVPLLGARREAAAAPTPSMALAAFDAPEIARSIDGALHSFARARAGDNAPARRALEAELTDIAEPLRDALNVLDARAREARASVDNLTLWRAWSAQLHATFGVADRVWLLLDAALGAAPPRPAQPSRKGRTLGVLLVASGLGLAAHAARLDGQHHTLRVRDIPAESLLARGFDVVEPRRDGSLIVANPEDEARLATLGWRGRASPVVASGVARAMQPAAPVVYRSFDDKTRGVRAFLDSLALANPLVHVDSFGASYQGRPLLAVKIGSPDDSPSRPNVIIMATYHAREWAATETVLRLLRYLASPENARVDSLVRNRDIWIIPVVNPDGYQFTFDGDRLWRKNRRPFPAGAGGAATIGVDLNRNHAERWGYDDDGSSGLPSSELYRGPAPSSELETQAVERFHRQHPPITAISYHTYAARLLYPPGFAYGKLPGDASIFRAIAGTDEHPAIVDQLPVPLRPVYRPSVAWNLYATNGEYTDWVYGQLGAIAFTVELTSGSEGGAYYGFEFPDDDGRLGTLFRDNLPFALDVIEAARDPLRARPLASGLPVEPIALESVSPIVAVRTPGAAAPTVRTGFPVPVIADSLGYGTYTHRWIASTGSRPGRVAVETPTVRAAFTPLAVGGAEIADTGWTAADGMSVQQGGVAGTYEWRGSRGTLRSPAVTVPVDVDTVSVLFWTRYDGDGFSQIPHGEIRLSTDGGTSWTRVGVVSGAAPAYYPDRATVTGVAGRTVRFEFSSPDNLFWRLDEVAIVAHSGARQLAADTTRLRPSANPVRGDVVFFNWPFVATAGVLQIYDFAGRLAWRTSVDASAESVPWNVRDSGVVNGVYLAVARAGGRTRTFKLFIARRGT